MNHTTPSTEGQGAAMAAEALSVAIAVDNDAFRKMAASSFGRFPAGIAGRLVYTQGVMDIPEPHFSEVFERVAEFTDFNGENDPHGEHDFGSFDIAGQTVNWKFDYFADATCAWGSEDPSDRAKTFRVLTVMLASEPLADRRLPANAEKR